MFELKGLNDCLAYESSYAPKSDGCPARRSLKVGDLKFLEACSRILSELEFEIRRSELHTERMPRVESAWRTIDRLPARRPFAAVTVVRRCIKSQTGDHSERVTLPCVDGDPSAWAAITVAAKLS